MIDLGTFRAFMDGLREAYLHAVEKHPQYTDLLVHFGIDGVRNLTERARVFNDNPVNKPSFFTIISEELGEYMEASLLGDHEAAKRELLDVAAVVLREWERVGGGAE